jgi:hypothetical protein
MMESYIFKHQIYLVIQIDVANLPMKLRRLLKDSGMYLKTTATRTYRRMLSIYLMSEWHR